MKHIYFSFVFVALLATIYPLKAQVKKEITDTDRSALEGIIVEKYYISGSTDYVDTIGNYLPKGSVTYRIYVDLKAGYTMQGVFGIANHELRIETSSEFFNTKNGERTGDQIDNEKINQKNLALDSWLTLGAATKSHWGVLKIDDKDGSILTKPSLDKMDGLTTMKVRPVSYYGNDLKFFQDSVSAKLFSSNDIVWAVFGGVKNTSEDNKILIAQLTTNGKLSFELNVQVGTPTGASMQYVAKNPEGAEIQFDGLSLKK